MSRLSLLEDQLRAHQNILDALEQSDAGYVSAFTRLTSQIMALQSLLAEIAERHSVSSSEFQRHFRIRADYFLDRFLSDAERQSSALGAALDDRDPAAVPTSDGYPPLFPETPPL